MRVLDFPCFQNVFTAFVWWWWFWEIGTNKTVVNWPRKEYQQTGNSTRPHKCQWIPLVYRSFRYNIGLTTLLCCRRLVIWIGFVHLASPKWKKIFSYSSDFVKFDGNYSYFFLDWDLFAGSTGSKLIPSQQIDFWSLRKLRQHSRINSNTSKHADS